MQVKEAKLEFFAGPTAAEGLFEIIGDYAADVSRAVREDHYCDDSHCDIREAWDADCPLTAAYLLYGATECPALDAVRFAYSLRAGGIPVDFARVHPSELPDWKEWLEHFKAYGVECHACGTFTFGDDYWTPSECGNCGSSLADDEDAS